MKKKTGANNRQGQEIKRKLQKGSKMKARQEMREEARE